MWEKVRLGDIIEILSGYAFDSKKFNDKNGIPIIRIRDIKRSFSETFYAGEYDPKYLINNGDVLIGMDGEFNISEWLGEPALLNQRVCKINSYKSELIERKYLLHFLPLELKYIEDKTAFVTVKHLSVNDIKEIQIPLPPLPIQKRIAEILDTADALRRKEEALLKKYDELAQAIFIDMFGDPVKNEKGWEVKTLKSCTSKIGSGSTPIGGKTAYKEQGISLIRSMNVYDNYFKMKDLAFIDDIQAEKLKNVEVKSNDVLFNITGASVCRCTIVPEEILPARVNQHVAILRAKEELLSPKFLSTLLTTNSMKKQLLNIGIAGGAVMEAITKEQLENQNIILPPIEVQNRFANILKNLNEQNQKSSNSQKESDSLFNSLLQKAFNGELVA